MARLAAKKAINLTFGLDDRRLHVTFEPADRSSSWILTTPAFSKPEFSVVEWYSVHHPSGRERAECESYRVPPRQSYERRPIAPCVGR